MTRISNVDDTIYNLPITQIEGSVERGWWEVRVRCEPDGRFYSGKKDRSYFRALEKAIDAAMVETGHRAAS